MALTLTPSEVKTVVVLPTDNICTALVKTFIRFPLVYYRWYKWAYNPDGTISDEFKKEICDACKIVTPTA